MKTLLAWSCAAFGWLAAAMALRGSETTADGHTHDFLRDRDNGVMTSLLGSFVRDGQRMAYTFYEYEHDSSAAYTGKDLGFTGEEEYFGSSTEHQAVLFLAWGLTPNLAVEFESNVYHRATLARASDDTTSGMPERITESRYGAIEAQVHWRLARETVHRPEFFANFEVGPPDAGDIILLGNTDWEVGAGVGAIKGFRWGAMAARASLVYDTGEVAVGEFAVEYCRRLSEKCRIAAAVVGESEKLSVLGELQWRFRDGAFTRLNLSVGVTDRAPDFGAQLGVVFGF